LVQEVKADCIKDRDKRHNDRRSFIESFMDNGTFPEFDPELVDFQTIKEAEMRYQAYIESGGKSRLPLWNDWKYKFLDTYYNHVRYDIQPKIVVDLRTYHGTQIARVV